MRRDSNITTTINLTCVAGTQIQEKLTGTFSASTTLGAWGTYNSIITYLSDGSFWRVIG